MKLWLNVAEGAEYAGVCRDDLHACAARRIHHIRIGGRRAIRLKPSGSTTQRYSHLSPAALDATIRLLENRTTMRAVGDSLETPKG
jgi:hypothetical protein